MYKIDEIKMLRLGQRDENLARPLTFDCSDWLEQYPEASIHILFRRPGESAIVPMSTTLEGTTLTWLIHDFEVGKTGVGNAEFRAVDTAGLRRKSRIIPCSIEETLLGDDETVLYTQDQVDDTLAHISEAAQAAQAAKASEEAAALSAQEAAESATSASAAASVAASARDAAQAAKIAAETAQHQAESAQSGVHTDAEAAEQAKVAAQAAQASAQGAASQASADRAAAESARASAEAAAEHAEAVVEGIDQAGADQVAAVNAEGQAQVTAVDQAGTTQVGNVNAAGTTQVNAVQAKGTQVINSIPADYSTLSSDVTLLESALNLFENDLFGANKRVFNVIAGTTHGAVKGFWPVAIKSGTQYSIDLISDAITGYQLYAYYVDGTNERIYSGRVFSNTYIASKDIESFGFYIASTFVSASGEVAAILSVSNGFYDNTINLQDTLEMTHDIVGESTLTWPITAGVAISASDHEIPVVIDSGEAFSIKILTLPYGAVTAVQYWLMYVDGTDERIYSSPYSLVYRGKAKKKISAIRLFVGATGVVATGMCTIIVNRLDNTMVSKLIAETNKNAMIKVVNHRGYNTAPENTIPAYILSYKAGFKYVETDVQLTSDGVPVLLHDGTINRTARTTTGEELSGPVNISDITYEQALTYDFGIYKGTEYAGTKIPTLREFVLLCKRLSLHPYIEIKPTGFTEEQVKGLVDIVISCGMRDNVTWISQNHGYLAYVSNYCSKCRLGLVVSSVTSDNVLVAAGLKTTNNSVFVNSGSITADAVTLCIGQNLPLEYWVENTESTLNNIDPYVSGISSDSINVAEYYIDRVLSTGTATWS